MNRLADSQFPTIDRRTLRQVFRQGAITLALLALLWGAAFSLSIIIRPPWLTAFYIITGLVALLLIGTRYIVPPKYQKKLPPTIGLIGGFWFLLSAFGAKGGYPTPWPTAGASERLYDLGILSIHEIQTHTAPLAPTTPILFITILASVLILILADSLAHSRFPLISVLPMLTLWIPNLGLGWEVGRISFIATIAGLLLLLMAVNHSRTSTIPRTSRITWRPVLAASLVMIVALGTAVGATTSAANKLERTRLFNYYATGDGTGGFGVTLKTNQILGNRSKATLFTYTTSTGNPVGPLRFATYSNFDGQTWSSLPAMFTAAKNKEIIKDGGHALLGDRDGLETNSPVKVSVKIVNLADGRLPLTGDPRRITTNGQWQLDVANDIAVPRRQIRRGDQVDIAVVPRPLDAARLREALGGNYDTAEDAVLPITGGVIQMAGNGTIRNNSKVDSSRIRQLALPENEAEFLMAQAQFIAGNAPSSFDAAVILQNYLRNSLQFTYSTSPPPAITGNMVTDFLSARSGYCVHFASAMVLLSRALGIPARLAVGYLPGRQIAADKWEVTGRDSHAWAELYFGPQIGWVTFDPTPADISGTPPLYTITATIGEQPWLFSGDYMAYMNEVFESMSSSGGLADSDSEALTLPHTTASDAAGGAGWLSSPWQYLVAASFILGSIFCAGYAVRLARKKQHWDEEVALHRAAKAIARHGIEIEPATTPRQMVGAVAAGWQAKYQTAPPANMLAALGTITNAIEETRYCGVANSLRDIDLRLALKEIANAKPQKARHLVP